MTNKLTLSLPDELFGEIEKNSRGKYNSKQEYILEKIREAMHKEVLK